MAFLLSLFFVSSKPSPARPARSPVNSLRAGSHACPLAAPKSVASLYLGLRLHRLSPFCLNRFLASPDGSAGFEVRLGLHDASPFSPVKFTPVNRLAAPDGASGLQIRFGFHDLSPFT